MLHTPASETHRSRLRPQSPLSLAPSGSHDLANGNHVCSYITVQLLIREFSEKSAGFRDNPVAPGSGMGGNEARHDPCHDSSDSSCHGSSHDTGNDSGHVTRHGTDHGSCHSTRHGSGHDPNHDSRHSSGHSSSHDTRHSSRHGSGHSSSHSSYHGSRNNAGHDPCSSSYHGSSNDSSPDFPPGPRLDCGVDSPPLANSSVLSIGCRPIGIFLAQCSVCLTMWYVKSAVE